MNHRYAHILTPIKIGNVILKNRLLSSKIFPMELQGPENFPSESTMAYLANLAKNGAATVTVPVGTFPNADGTRSPMSNFPMENRGVQNYFFKMLDRIHAYGSLVSAPLMGVEPQEYNISDTPNFDEIKGKGDYSRIYGNKPGIPLDKLEQMLDSFVKACVAFKRMGFDMVTIYMSYRGSILANSLSPAFNQRKDKYGGSFENRAHLTLELFQRIKDACGPDFLIESQISGMEEQPYGYTMEDFLNYCKLCEGLVDIFQIRGWDGKTSHPSSYNYIKGQPYTLQFAEAFKKRGIKSLCAPIGGFKNLDDIEKFLAEGKCDLVSLGRAFISDSEYGKKLYEGRGEDVVPCVLCNKCHGAICTVNPTVGLAHVLPDMFDAPQKIKKVAVIGGGPAGMEAAIIAADRGHKVTLFEKNKYLGGQLYHADFASFKRPMKDFKDYLIRQVGKKGVEVVLGKEVTPDIIAVGGYDAVVAAVGATPKVIDIPGSDGKNVWAPIDVYGREDELGENVVVIGGAEIGAETALHLAQKGINVTVLTRQDEIAYDSNLHGRGALVEAWEAEGNFHFIIKATTTKIEAGSVTYKDAQSKEHTLKADSVVVSAGRTPRADEAIKFAGLTTQFFVVGDCRTAGDVQKSIYSAYTSAFQI